MQEMKNKQDRTHCPYPAPKHWQQKKRFPVHSIKLVALSIGMIVPFAGSLLTFPMSGAPRLLGHLSNKLGFGEFRGREISAVQDLPSVSVTEFHSILEESDSDIQLIDVREPEELAIANLNHLGFQNYPLRSFERWSSTISNELQPSVPTFVICHHGMRSAQMTAWLLEKGFADVTNISGGIAAWSAEVDPVIPQY